MNNDNNKNHNEQSKRIVSTSKFLSLVLRHEPGRAGISLGEGGWVAVADRGPVHPDFGVAKGLAGVPI
jgi:RNA:NAD 2'-phosphotransferase (TPT1/KptA family)